ncbi:hypothetical protein L6164_012394 [Bauhinia variegata]|uniref:Uncharacterized protein n=1 Tax=Bauhinia variegata TaxID=167791 RepID=A0ACB9P9V9_BAUVA|nr:hypothetical protein L6164_012394 [Bauhinia variegata]
MSIEAMAIAGMDYNQCAINFEEWDSCWRQQTPLYLQVGANLCTQMEKKRDVNNVQEVKAMLRQWAKAVASKQESASHVRNQTINVLR